MELTAAQKLIDKRVMELDAKVQKLEERMERGIDKVRQTGADHAEKVYRKRWAAKIAPVIEESDALRESLPKE